MSSDHPDTAAAKPAVAVLGAGSWGTALAALIARHGHSTVLWGRDASTIAAIDGRHENPRYLPGIPLPHTLRATPDLAAAMAGCDLVLVVVPSHAFAETLHALAPLRPAHAGVAWATKGFEPGSGRFLHEVADELLPPGVPLAVVTGPSFAKEVAAGLPTALTVHSDTPDFAQQVADALHGPAFRAYTGEDMLGAELGGAMKNVLAVATGVADGMNLGLNARAGLITRGLNEMLRLNLAIGGKAETLMGLAGLGDLVLTCTGELSRNRAIGVQLAHGRSLAEITRDMRTVAEGIKSTGSVVKLGLREKVSLPISEQMHAVLHGERSPEQAIRILMERSPGGE